MPQASDLDTTKISMTILMTPNLANFSGNVHGGDILKLIDEVAYACACRYSGSYAVTLSVDQVLFKTPIHVGELVTFYASVNYVGNTSMEIGVKVVAEDIKTKERRHTNSCYLTMVALDETKKPAAIPPYNPRTDLEKQRFEAAKIRRSLRKEQHLKHKEIKDQVVG